MPRLVCWRPMNFGVVLDTLSGFLQEKDHRFAVIGGVALAAYGLPRTTLDLDFVIDAAAQNNLIPFLESLGYQTLHRSSGYSNHVHSDPTWGRVDFVYVQEDTSSKLFADSRSIPGPGGIPIPVPKPEHLAALKVLGMKNDPARTFQDLADVRFLLTLPGVDRVEIRDYFERHGLRGRFEEIERTI